MSFVNYTKGLKVILEASGSIPDQVHVFEERQASAIDAALAAKRPLLVRGETGTGKSQLARAAAYRLNRTFVHYVVDSQTEARDLLWELDSLGRFAEAQLAGALAPRAEPEHYAARLAQLKQELSLENFLKPGPLWWAFDWEGAAKQASKTQTPLPMQSRGADPANGTVVLIDEIDKAESEVPNGLLEALGTGQILLPGGSVVKAPKKMPLVIITTNDERALPDAFVRRCLVLVLRLPINRSELIDVLMERGIAHFPNADKSVLKKAAEMLADDRESDSHGDLRALPGQAEYFDLLRAVLNLYSQPASQIDALTRLAEYTIKKHGI